jgi:argininosuccinate lyase
MPGYTHMQPAQPWSFGHYLLGFAERLRGDSERLWRCFEITNISPMGTVGGNGTSWPVDRASVAALLGFAGPIGNAKLARDIQYLGDIAAAASLLMATLNDLAVDLQLWSTHEFGLVELDDAFCGTSSIFPQKKNPIALETVRSVAAHSTQWFGAVLALSRGLGTGDLAMRNASFVDDMLEQPAQMAGLLADVVASLKINTATMRERAGAGWSTASSLADELVRHGSLSYRGAHHLVGRLVRHCVDNGIGAGDVTVHTLQASGAGIDLMNRFTDAQLQAALDPVSFAAAMAGPGGMATPRLVELLAASQAEHGALQDRWSAVRQAIARSATDLDSACQNLQAELR